MQYKLPSLAAVALLSLATPSVFAQTVAGFEEKTLLAETDFASTQAIDKAYTFESGLIKFFGETTAWGTYSNFNFSNVTDTAKTNNDLSAISGNGANGSTNFGVCYVNIDFMGPDPSVTIPSGVKLLGEAIGKPVSGFYANNSTYAYHYTSQPAFVNAKHWFMLTVKGYLNGKPSSDSVNFMLADYRNGQKLNVKTWEWVNLSALGNVDSLTFDLSSDDTSPYGINVPAYFALDNLTTLEDPCSDVKDLMVSNISENSARFTWASTQTNFFEFAIDTSRTLAPLGTPVLVNDSTFKVIDLDASTNYTMHIRAVCNDSTFSNWDTLSFVTNASTGIHSFSKNEFQLKISPNPTRDFIQIHTEDDIDVLVYNYLGQELLKVQATKRINVAHLPNGVYFLKAINPKNNKTSSLRFIKY